MQESLVLSDLTKKAQVKEILAALTLPGVDYDVEMAMDYPGQQLAVDLAAGDKEMLDRGVKLVQAALQAKGILSRSTAEIEADLALYASA